MLPTREGAVFTDRRFAVLLSIQHELDARYFQWNNSLVVEEYERFIGGGWCIRIHPTTFMIENRKYFHLGKANERRPTKTGIQFHLQDWRYLAECIEELCQVDPGLRDVVPCFSTHETYEDSLQCYECSPFYMRKPKSESKPFNVDLSLLYTK